MPNNIANVTIEASVIQLNNTYYLRNGQYAPVTQNVPCGINAEVDYFSWWMTPVQDYGIVSILQAIPAIGENVNQPTSDSISVVRVRDKYKPHWTWWIVSSLEDYYNACAACCGDSPVPIPTPDLPVIIPCQTVCDSTNADGDYIAVFGIPDLPSGMSFLGHAIINDEALTDATGSDAASLLTSINTNWGTIASPSESIVWTKSADGLTLTGTGFSKDDAVCVVIETVDTSP